MPALSVLFFFIIEHRVLIVLVFYYKGILEKVTMQRTQQFSTFPLLPKQASEMQRIRSETKKIAIECGRAFPEMHVFLESNSSEFSET